MDTIKKFIIGHKFISGLIALVLIWGVYHEYKVHTDTSGITKYALAQVAKGTLVSSISGSGQVASSDQIDIKPKASGDVIGVYAQDGQKVYAGQLIAQLDATIAIKAVRDAELNLESTQIALAKLQIGQQSNVPKINDEIKNAQNNVTQSYQNGLSEMANSFQDLPSALNLVRGVLYDSTVGTSGQTNSGAYQNLVDDTTQNQIISLVNQAGVDYQYAYTQYNTNLSTYNGTGLNSSNDQILTLIGKTLDISKAMAQAVKDEQSILSTVTTNMKQLQPNRSIPSAITQYQSDLTNYTTKLGGHITNLTNIQNAIASNQQNLVSYQRDLASAQQSDPLDLQSQQNSIKQREAALQDAKDNLAYYSVRSPITGVLAKVNVKKGDSASSGTVAATVIANQQVANVSLNEVDAAKIQVSQKATLTFDAIPDLTLTGQVAEVDSIGTVSQGVVTYNVKIIFDSQDSRIKGGMSVTAAIITLVKQDTLMIPNSAVKSQGGNYYVDVPASSVDSSSLSATTGIILNPTPTRQSIQVGVSNDTDTEITNGLKEGDIVVSKTISPSSTTTSTTQTRSLFGNTGGGRGGNAVFGH